MDRGMEHLHFEVDARAGDLIEMTVDHPANVQLMDSDNYNNYRNGQQFRYHGGYVKTSPARLRPPTPGKWHVVVDLGGGPGKVRASAQIIPKAYAIHHG